jgi:hypothetical protein
MKDVFTMNQTIRLHVKSPLPAIDAKSCCVTIPESSVIETTDDVSQPGFHRVRFDGQDLLAFGHDIQERTEQVSSEVM